MTSPHSGVSSLYDLTIAELQEWLTRQGEPAYRTRQIFEAVYRQGIRDPRLISTIPADLCARLAEAFPSQPLEPVQERASADGARKWLFRLADGKLIESVLIPAGARRTVCVSSQVGCAYGCAFCASGLQGFQRNLTAGEIVQQVLLASPSKRATHVVFMGMGEPLANYGNVLQAIRILNDPEGLKIGARKITISTVGLVPMIERLSKEGLQVELSVSLHAPNDELRGRIMPVNRKHPVKELLQAAQAYVKATQRLITFEYILIDGVNDGPEEARELSALLQGLLCKVNLIPCHPIPGAPFARPPAARILEFERALRAKGIRCTLRRSRGLDVDGACGQLRLQQLGAGAVVQSSPEGAASRHGQPARDDSRF